MPNKLNVAVVGHGKMGAILARNINEHSGFHIATVCDANPSVADELKSTAYQSAKFTTDIDDVLHDPAIDAVVIATLPDSHYKLAKAALAAGKHVLVEKPVSQTVAQAEELAALAKERNLKLMVDHTLVYEQAAKELQRELASRNFGKAERFELTRIQPLCARLQHRNCFEELSPHVFSVLDMLDNYSSRSAEVTYLDGDLERGVKARIKTESGLEGIIHFAFSDKISPLQEERRTIVSLKKRLGQDTEISHKASWDERRDPLTREQTITITDQEGRLCREIKTGKILPLTAVINDLHDCITKNLEPVSNGVTSIRVMQLMDGVVRSRTSHGRPVTVNLEPLKIDAPAKALRG